MNLAVVVVVEGDHPFVGGIDGLGVPALQSLGQLAYLRLGQGRTVIGCKRDQVGEEIAVAVDAFDHVRRQEYQVVG
jgi:hypothetical protein